MSLLDDWRASRALPRPPFKEHLLHYLRTLHHQPPLVFIAATALGPWIVLRGGSAALACSGPSRSITLSLGLILYMALVPTLAMTLWHLCWVRPRTTDLRHRVPLDVAFAIFLAGGLFLTAGAGSKLKDVLDRGGGPGLAKAWSDCRP